MILYNRDTIPTGIMIKKKMTMIVLKISSILLFILIYFSYIRQIKEGKALLYLPYI
jgi:hypothetical protein